MGHRDEFPRGKLNVKSDLLLNLYFGFSISLVFSSSLVLCFSDYFPVMQGFSSAIHNRIHYHFSSFFSECWLLDSVQWPVGPVISKFTTLTQTFNYAVDYSNVKYEKYKGYFDVFECPRRLFHLNKWTCAPKRGRIVALLNNATHTLPV